jgi:hypothetical protein
MHTAHRHRAHSSELSIITYYGARPAAVITIHTADQHHAPTTRPTTEYTDRRMTTGSVLRAQVGKMPHSSAIVCTIPRFGTTFT